MTDFEPSTRIALCALLWGYLIVKLYKSLVRSRQGTVGLPFAYVLTTMLVHIGALVYLDPGYDNTFNRYLESWSYTPDTVATGLEVSVLGILGFTGGVSLANHIISSCEKGIGGKYEIYLLKESKILFYIGAGSVVFTFIGIGIVNSLPGLQALTVGLYNLLILAVCGFLLYLHQVNLRSRYLVVGLAGAAGLVAIQMIRTGILGDSVAAALIVVCFMLAVSQRRKRSITKGIVMLAVISYTVVASGVVWMEIRDDLRTAVNRGAGFSERVEVVAKALSSTAFFDPTDVTHLELIDMRMNHNVIIGKTVENIADRPELIRHGDSIMLALFGWVPRIIWTSKPTRGGSDEVSLYIGRAMSSGSTFGTGPIFELYINFLYTGVLVGMAIYGFILRWFDIRSAMRLYNGQALGSSNYFAAGVAMVTAMDSLFFIVNGIIACFLLSVLIGRLGYNFKKLNKAFFLDSVG